MPHAKLSRRAVLAATALTTGAAVIGGPAALATAAAATTPVDGYPARRITGYDTLSYLNYPHNNGFFRGGSHVLIRKQAFPSDLPAYLTIHNLKTGTFQTLPERKPGRPMLGGYFDVNYRTGLLVIPESAAQAALDGTTVRVWAINLNAVVEHGTAEWREVFRLPPNTTVADTMVGIHPDGTKIAFSIMSNDLVPGGELPGDRHCRIVEVDLGTGAERTLVEHDLLSNHVHYSPANPEWVMFTREGDVNLHTQRIWGYHPVHAPHGANIGNQLLPNGSYLRVGHERACFDEEATVACNYAAPRSLYKFYFDQRPPVELARGWFEHCDVSRDGRFVVSDTGGPAYPGQTSLTVVDLGLGNTATTVLTDLTRGLNHPRHIHPVFSPDGRYVFFNDPDPVDRNAAGLRVGYVDLRPHGFSDALPIVIGRVNTEVPNRRGPSDRTFLDELYKYAPFGSPDALRRRVDETVIKWRRAGLLSDAEGERVRLAAR
ncbi:hypothetical protein [Microlunatus sp. GCM10028923]|uniref:hypothetical protein n=1 Tax=Microlunatus sp. GCM10028923 TaxID=3273400 RepID=UPI003621439C